MGNIFKKTPKVKFYKPQSLDNKNVENSKRKNYYVDENNTTGRPQLSPPKALNKEAKINEEEIYIDEQHDEINDVELNPIVFKRVRALFDFIANDDDELSFKSGDILEILEENKNQEDEWLKACIEGNSKKIGLIPTNFVTEDVNEEDYYFTNIKKCEWFFDVDRREAERELLNAVNQEGAFLVRYSSSSNSDDSKKSYVISKLSSKTDDKEHVKIKHKIIKTLDNGRLYLYTKNQFNSVQELVDYYRSIKTKSAGFKLGKPCSKQPDSVPFKKIEIPKCHITLDKRIGGGFYGEVFSGMLNQRLPVAIKMLKGDGHMSISSFLTEAKIMHKLRHKKLVQLIGISTIESPIYIITELLINGSLKSFLKNKKNKMNLADENNNNNNNNDYDDDDDIRDNIKRPRRSKQLDVLLDMAIQILDGMRYLEKKNFVHRDLRADNVLVGENNLVKIADFGLAKLLDGEDIYGGDDDDDDEDEDESDDDMRDNKIDLKSDKKVKLPVRWTAPESLKHYYFSTKSDVWSFGILLYEMVTFGKLPYHNLKRSQVKAMVPNGHRLSKPTLANGSNNDSCPQYLFDLMTSCWNSDPEDRPSFEDMYVELSNK